MKNKLKSTLALLLTFCIMLSFTACDGGSSNAQDNISKENNSNNENNKQDSTKGDTIKYQIPLSVINPAISISEDDQEKLVGIMNSGKWTSEETQCEFDFEISTKGQKLCYHSDCGTFKDATNNRYLLLDNESKKLVNSIFGAPEQDFKIQTDRPDEKRSLRILQYEWDGYWLSKKIVADSEIAYYLIDALDTMTETGETVEAMSDETFDESIYPSDKIPRGTIWIEANGKIYRYEYGTAGKADKLCIVESYFGSGYVLNMSEEFKNTFMDAKFYYPRNYYKGNYDYNTKSVNLTNVFQVESEVNVKIKEMDRLSHKIIVEVISTKDQRTSINLVSQASPDHLGANDEKLLDLRRCTPCEVELSYESDLGNDATIYIRISNITIEIG